MFRALIPRLMSFRTPHLIERCEGLFGPLEVCWERGRKVINSAHANQSHGALHRVLHAALRPALREIGAPRNTLLLGLGGGSAVRIIGRELRMPHRILAVELDPAMIDLAARHFGMKNHDRLQVVQGDAIILAHTLRERFDLVVVDLFADSEPAQGGATSGFIHALRDRLAEGGRICFNTMAYDARTREHSERVHGLLRRAFLHVRIIEAEGVNRVFIAH
jgi:spermidine synthase